MPLSMQSGRLLPRRGSVHRVCPAAGFVVSSLPLQPHLLHVHWRQVPMVTATSVTWPCLPDMFLGAQEGIPFPTNLAESVRICESRPSFPV